MNLKNPLIKSISVATFLLVANDLAAQSGAGMSASTILTWVVVFLVLFALLFIGDGLLKLQAKNVGVEDESNYSIFPKWSDIVRPKTPAFTYGKKLHTLKKGYDIKLQGVPASKEVDTDVPMPTTFAVKPTDFLGIAPIPKMMVAIGDNVKAGDPLFYDKRHPDIHFCAPVSGEIAAINRGAKRAIVEVVILADKEQEYRTYDFPDLTTVSREDLVAFLAGSGVWPMIKRRPYDLIAELDEVPRDIFISTFDTAPLAPNSNLFVEGKEKAFQKGLDVLAKLTTGKVYLGLDGRNEPAAAYADATGVEKHYFHGAHPAGNVGVQIHHIRPIKSGDIVWTLGPQEVITIGSLFTEARFDATRVVALTGAELANPRHIKVPLGACIEGFVKDGLHAESEGTPRYISGDVLTGDKIEEKGFLGFFDDQLTVVEEGDEHEMFGWLLPLEPRPSISRSLPGFLMPNMKFHADTNTHGEKRAFVVTGQYEKVLPMDIYPQHLMKSIMMGDFERMEGLGINELSPEDVALCEFVCTSKQPLQDLLRQGHEMMIEQG